MSIFGFSVQAPQVTFFGAFFTHFFMQLFCILKMALQGKTKNRSVPPNLYSTPQKERLDSQK